MLLRLQMALAALSAILAKITVDVRCLTETIFSTLVSKVQTLTLSPTAYIATQGN
jgi:hypothetical protein